MHKKEKRKGEIIKMKKIAILLIVISLFFCGLVKSAIVFADEADEPDNTDYIHQAITVSPHSQTIKRGQAYKLSATLDPVASNGTITWSSSNTSVATVTSYGLVVGKSAGTTTITATVDCPMIQGWTYEDHCIITVSSSRIVADGTYFVQTAQKTGSQYIDEFVSIEGNSTSSGAKLEIDPLSGDNSRKWNFTLGSDGYYRIKSVYSQKYLWVNNNSASSGASIKQYSSVASGSKWAIMVTSSNKYALVPASATSSLIVMNVPGSSTGTDLNTASYTSNTNYRDEWVLTRMLPTNGYELAYDPSLWSGTVQTNCNCYAYAINNQVMEPIGNQIWFKQQPGEYYNNHSDPANQITQGFQSSSGIIDAVNADFAKYNSINNASVYFISVSQYTKCPDGYYKIALALSSSDYHWYRQNSDGLWSHKQGLYPVTNLDASNNLIIDPATADRGSYTTFVGYYAVIPWNNMYVGSKGTDDNKYHFDSLPSVVDEDLLSRITIGMSLDDVIELLGSAGADIGSGTVIQQYISTDSKVYTIVYDSDGSGFHVKSISIQGEQ